MKRLGLERAAAGWLLAQAAWVKAKLEGKFPDIRIETILIKTSGDRFLEASVQPIGGIFTKEIEDALLRQADLMVIAGTGTYGILGQGQKSTKREVLSRTANEYACDKDQGAS